MRLSILFVLATLAMASATITSVSTDKTEYQAGDTVVVSWTYDSVPTVYYDLSSLVAFMSGGNVASAGQAPPNLNIQDMKTTIETPDNLFSSEEYFVLLRLVTTDGNFTELQSDYITILQPGQDLGSPGTNENRPPPSSEYVSAGSRLKPWWV